MRSSDKEIDISEFLSSVTDAEERERFRREFCYLEHDDRDKPGYQSPIGEGPNASLNRAVIGADLTQYFESVLQDKTLASQALQEREAASLAVTAARQYMCVEDVQAIYDAVSFTTQEHGVFMNGFITIVYSQLGIKDPEKMTKLLTEFLDEADDQLKRWGYAWHWTYVHESSQKNGLHSHVLIHMPAGHRDRFTEWARDGSRSFFKRHCGIATRTAVDIMIKEPSTVETKAKWQWDKVQYMTKGLNPGLNSRDESSGVMKPLFELLAQKPHYQRPAGAIPFLKRVGGSKTIWSGARKRVAADGQPALSAFDDRAWPYLRLNSQELGWEIKEFNARSQQRRDWQTGLESRLSFPIFESALASEGVSLSQYEKASKPAKAAIINAIKDSHERNVFEGSAYSRKREGWSGWWETLPGLAKWGGLQIRRELARREAEA